MKYYVISSCSNEMYEFNEYIVYITYDKTEALDRYTARIKKAPEQYFVDLAREQLQELINFTDIMNFDKYDKLLDKLAGVVRSMDYRVNSSTRRHKLEEFTVEGDEITDQRKISIGEVLRNV